MSRSRFCSTRRAFGAGVLGTVIAGLASAAPQPSRRRFLFVHAEGGWDPLCVFAPLFGNSQIQMEADTQQLTTQTGFTLVDSAARPAVPLFFENWGSRTLLMNGVSTRSVNHETCQAVALTGSTSDRVADWATSLAVADASSYYLPHLVLNGPAYPGGNTVVVSRAEGRVQDAVHGTLLEVSDAPMASPLESSRLQVDTHLAARTAEFAAHSGAPGAADYQSALARALVLTHPDNKHLVSFDPPTGYFQDLARNAITLLGNGVTRCATVSTGFTWDTHDDNSRQTTNFEVLFTDLDFIMNTLTAENLAEEVVVVVLSEMGRTPQYNGTLGRDHWPYTSAMIIGPGVQGGLTIGRFNELYAGVGVDPASGALDPSRKGIDPNLIGATLLTLGGADPGDFMASPEVMTGVLT